MKSIRIIAAAGAAAFFAAGAANAGVISFAGYAAGNEHGINSGDSVNFSGVEISFLAGSDEDPGGTFYPYFDDVSGGLPAGLGVCRELVNGAGSACLDSGDDSADGDVGIREHLILQFQTAYDLAGISFRDGLHNLINDSANLVDWYVISSAGHSGLQQSSIADFVTLVTAGSWTGVTEFGVRYINQEFYIESISDIPLPGALPLLLAGLAGLGFAGRGRKTA